MDVPSSIAISNQPSATTSSQNPCQVTFSDPMLRDFLPVHEQHWNLHAVARLGRGIARDVDLLDRDRRGERARHARDHVLHLVAKMAAGPRIHGQRERYELIHSLSRAVASTAPTRSVTRGMWWRSM